MFKLPAILILTIVLRFLLVSFPSFKIDMGDWIAWTSRLVNATPLHFYAPDYFSDYFPGYLYMLWFFGGLFKFLLPSLSIFSMGFEIYLKFFTNLFDIATAYYIYKIVSNYQKGLGLIPSILYLANPALAFNSSVWGQVDGILTFFLIYAVYCLLELKKVYRFSIISALSILIKPQGLTIFPVIILYLITNFKYKKYFSLLLIPVLLIFLSLPFFLKDPVLGLFHLFQKSASIYPYTSMFSYNLWSLVGWWVPDSNILFGFSYQVWGMLIYFLFLILILAPLFLRRNYKNNLLVYLSISLAIFAFFLFLTRIHQRYLFPFFAFLLIGALIKNSLKLKILYFVLSLIHFINLWYVYYYYNFVYNNPKFSSFIIYKILNQSSNLFTAFNLLGFGVLMLIYYKNAYAKKTSQS